MRAGSLAQRGMVTVETAIAVPIVLAVGLVAAGAPAVVGAHVSCTDAAREAALMVARSAPGSLVTAVVDELAPPGARVEALTRGDLVEVTVRATVAPVPGPLGKAVSLPVSGRSVALRESAGVHG